MSGIESILKPKSYWQAMRDLRSMDTYEFVFRYRNKSLIKFWGIGFKKKFLHLSYRINKPFEWLYQFWFLWFVIGMVWTVWIFPYSSFWGDLGFIDNMFLSSCALMFLMLPFWCAVTVTRFIIRRKWFRKLGERSNHFGEIACLDGDDRELIFEMIKELL